MKKLCVAGATLIALTGLFPAQAQEPTSPSLKEQLQELKHLVLQMREEHRREVEELRLRLQRFETAGIPAVRGTSRTETRPGNPAADVPGDAAALEAELATEMAADPTAGPPATTTPAVYADVSFIGTFAGGVTSLKDDRHFLQHGGGHQPQGRGFNANLEMAASGAVDPYFTANVHAVFQVDAQGETLVELEEAYMTTLSLPAGLQAKGGQFFTAFGRQNLLHQHAWEFVELPIANARFFGPDGLRNPGIQLSWLTPLPFYAEVITSVQNASGETAASFLHDPEEANETFEPFGGFAGRTLTARGIESPEDLLYVGRVVTSFDLTGEFTLLGGISAASGPNSTGGPANDAGLDSSGHHHQTQIYGADVFLRWKPAATDRGWPFVSWQTEFLHRRYEAAALVIDADLDGTNDTIAVPRETLDDWGVYSQAIWGFATGWTVGGRYEYARGEREAFDLGESFGDVDGDGAPDFDRRYDSSRDPFRDRRQRISAALTWYPSEFSKIRLQYNRDRAEHLDRGFDDGDGTEHSGFLLFEFSLGKHGAHKY